ncbi:hypothetical protein COT75_03275 [Candidatus Beckwithbacteria bacterium CG10_big_fil_rev_8_21_14_0_10_34_10]|uniref:Cytidylate kinase-like family protein n=1 Tax=Candidatus Beckwithbacteria bacterium CG10_big_fil_rev_8_21_14_0_10_34_10 TaxID=1974495 RepID=A0A2H0W8V3_9BACT|nr:MAG: hypothetical protein COT75_03275 [Candidatus Beckwithbacteria bacterium CG10_big_fil_rev_8_21_14_0_10_34_10]
MRFKLKQFDKLLNKEISAWVFLKDRVSLKKKSKNKYFPCITVSRETGSGGRLAAQLAAKKLGFKYYNKKIVELIVSETKKREGLIQSLDENGANFLEETIGILFGTRINSSTYFRNLVKVILALGSKRNSVILGRGGNFIIPSKFGLRVRVMAPLKYRIKNAMNHEKISLKEAEQRIQETHFQRKNFVRKYFYKNISNANYYDLVINTKDLSVDQAAEIIVFAFKTKFPKFARQQ